MIKQWEALLVYPPQPIWVKGGAKENNYKFPPLPKLVKGDISLKFFTEQNLLIKYHKMLQQDNIKCNIGHQMM